MQLSQPLFMLSNETASEMLKSVSKIKAGATDSARLVILARLIQLGRANLGWSLRELSERTGVSASQILRMESGEFDFAVTKFLKVSEALGLPAGVLLETAAFHRIHHATLAEGDFSHLGRDLVRWELGSVDGPEFESAKKLVINLAGVAIHLALSSSPDINVQYYRHPCNLVEKAIEEYAAREHYYIKTNYENVAFVRSILSSPYSAVVNLKLFSKEVAAEYLHWLKAKKGKMPVLDKLDFEHGFQLVKKPSR